MVVTSLAKKGATKLDWMDDGGLLFECLWCHSRSPTVYTFSTPLFNCTKL